MKNHYAHARLEKSARAIGIVLAAASAAALMGGCNAAPKTVVKTVPGPTVTVTVPGPTAIVTKTVKVRVTSTVTPVPAATVAAPKPVAADPASSFDRAYAVGVVGNIIEDIHTVDHRLHDGIAVSSALTLLSDDYGRLGNAGTPPYVSAKDYHARLSTLESFASTAADEYDANQMQGSARYAVVRQQTAPLFQQLNTALGTHFTLPRTS